jgi:hypothetical protein
MSRAIRRLGAVALTGGTVAASTSIWPILLGPVGMFVMGATLAIEAIGLLSDDDKDTGYGYPE